MANEFKVKNGLIVIGDLTTSGTITINGALAATQSWVTSQAYLTSASLSGYATQSYVTSAISALVDSAPAALDTLKELATALGNDASFATTVTNSIASKLSLSGGTLTGLLTAPKLSLTTTGNDYYLSLNGLTMTSITTGETIWRNLSSFRFSDVNDWDYNSWAGLKFINSTKQIVLGVAGNVFTANTPQTGTLLLDRIATVYVNNTSQTVWHTGNLTNLNQLSNGPGYLTSYTETDTLASVTGRGATTNTSITVGPDLTVQADGSQNYTASRLWLNSHNNYRGAGVHMSGTGSTWFAGTPYTDFDGGYVIARTGTSNDVSSAQYSNALLTVKSNGNVGIGTGSPSYKLDVNGSFNAVTSGVYLTYNSGIIYHGGSYYQFPSGSYYYLYGRTGMGLIFGSNNAEVGRFDLSGNLGIGTTSPAYKLDVNGETRLGKLITTWSNSPITPSAVMYSESGYNTVFAGNGQFSSSYLALMTTGNMSYMGGNVGIGTTSPTKKLEIADSDIKVNGLTIGKGPGTISGNSNHNIAFGVNNFSSYSIADRAHIGIGYNAFQNITGGYYSIAIGGYAMDAVINPDESIAIGLDALGSATYPSRSVAIGNGALLSDTEGYGNVALGARAGNYLNSAFGGYGENTLIGNSAGNSLKNARETTVLGAGALWSTTSNTSLSRANTAIGASSAWAWLSGRDNVWLGYNTNGFINGSYNVIIGANISSTAIDGAGTLNNSIVLADGQGNVRIFSNSVGNVGIGTTNPIYKLQVVGSAYVNGGTLFLDSSQYLRWGDSNQGIVGENNNGISIVAGGSTRQTIYADGRTYFPGLDLSISNVNSSHGTGTYFRGSSTHFVLGLNNGNTLYLNYGNDGGSLQSFGTWSHQNVQILSTTRVLTNVSGNISMFTNDAGYLTSVSDVWVNTTGDTMTGALTIQGGWASTILDGDNVVLRKPNYSSGGWARTLLNFQEYDTTSLFQIGGYGNNNTLTYGYLGSAYNTPTIKWYSDKNVYFSANVFIDDAADNNRFAKGSSFLNLRDPWNNTHLSTGSGGQYYDAAHFYFRSTGGGTSWLYLDSSTFQVYREQRNYARVEFRYNADRYSQSWYNTNTGAYWWVTTDSDKLGLHLNGDGDKFYFGNNGDFYSTANGWLSSALAAKQNASTAINTSNIGSQSVNYANSAGSSGYASYTPRVAIEDTRAAQRTPDDYEDYRASWEFTNQITGLSGWKSAMTLQGWHNNYSAWQIIGGSDTSLTEDWYLRSGNVTTWNPVRRIWHSGDFSSSNISNWNTAYGWGNHASQGYATTSYVTTQINNLINGAPGALDTLSELASALGNDSSFATTVTNSIAGKMALYNGVGAPDFNTNTTNGIYRNQGGANGPAGGTHVTMFSAFQPDGNYGWQLASSSSDNLYFRYKDANFNSWVQIASQSWVTSLGYATTSSLANYLPLAGGTMSGDVVLKYDTSNNDGYFGLSFANGGDDYIIKASTTHGVFGRQSFGWHVNATSAFGVYSSGWVKLFGVEGGTGNTQVFGNLTVNGVITESSSLKLKENVQTSEGNLEKVVNLRPVTYNKIGSQTTELGLIAEEVAEVYPEFVQYDENGEPVGVHYSRLTAALIGAVKELTNQVQELNKKING